MPKRVEPGEAPFNPNDELGARRRKLKDRAEQVASPLVPNVTAERGRHLFDAFLRAKEIGLHLAGTDYDRNAYAEHCANFRILDADQLADRIAVIDRGKFLSGRLGECYDEIAAANTAHNGCAKNAS